MLFNSLRTATHRTSLLPNKPRNTATTTRHKLKRLKNNPNILIKKADKGNNFTILDKNLYISEANRQLSDSQFYSTIHHPLTQNNIIILNKICNDMLTDKSIDLKTFKFLTEHSVNPKSRRFYLLPKTHKPIKKWPHPKMPPGRPIVSDINSDTYNLAKFIDHFLQPLSTSHPSYIKNSFDFKNKLNSIIIPNNCLLVTADIDSLYTNIDCKLFMQTIEKDLSNLYHQPFTRHLMRLLQLNLFNNDFTFNGDLYLQTKGVAMGKAFAPSLANIFLIPFDHLACNNFKVKPLAFYRYIDDIFFIWPGSIQELEEFELLLNSWNPSIHLTFTSSPSSVNFLDLTIYISQGNIINTKIYFKPTDQHLLISPKSYHPRHVSKGILTSQLLRFKRLSSNIDDFNDTCKTLFTVLHKRGFSLRKLRSLKNNIYFNYVPKTSTSTPIIPITFTFNSSSIKLNRTVKSLIKNSQLYNDYNLVNAWRGNPNLLHLTNNKL